MDLVASLERDEGVAPDQDVAGSWAGGRGGIVRHTLHATWHRVGLLDWVGIGRYAVAADRKIDWRGLPFAVEAQRSLDAVTLQVNDAMELSASFVVASDDWRAVTEAVCGGHVVAVSEDAESEAREAALPSDKGTGRVVEVTTGLGRSSSQQQGT